MIENRERSDAPTLITRWIAEGSVHGKWPLAGRGSTSMTERSTEEN